MKIDCLILDIADKCFNIVDGKRDGAQELLFRSMIG